MICKNAAGLSVSGLVMTFALLFSVASSGCDAVQTESEDNLADHSAQLATRTYACGYALPGYNCDNGRRSAFITASSLRDAVALCPSSQPAGYTNFCYTLATDGGIAADPGECAAIGGSWRPGNSCCNFRGTLSCPATRTYGCGYALPGYNCNNGRTHAFINASSMTAAVAACPAARPAGYTDSCYVLDSTGGTAADAVGCAAAGGSWRPGNSCCNFKGTLSCP